MPLMSDNEGTTVNTIPPITYMMGDPLPQGLFCTHVTPESTSAVAASVGRPWSVDSNLPPAEGQ